MRIRTLATLSCAALALALISSSAANAATTTEIETATCQDFGLIEPTVIETLLAPPSCAVTLTPICEEACLGVSATGTVVATARAGVTPSHASVIVQPAPVAGAEFPAYCEGPPKGCSVSTDSPAFNRTPVRTTCSWHPYGDNLHVLMRVTCVLVITKTISF